MMFKKIMEKYEAGTFMGGSFPIGLEDAIIGVCHDIRARPRIIYSVKKSIEIMARKMTVEPFELKEGETLLEKKNELAYDWLMFNEIRAYDGEQSPVWCYDNF